MTTMHRPSAVEGTNCSVARTRILNLAEGVLVGLLNSTPEHSLNQLLSAARSSGVSPYAIAFALVSVSSGQRALDCDDPATATVRRCWGAALRRITGAVPTESDFVDVRAVAV